MNAKDRYLAMEALDGVAADTSITSVARYVCRAVSAMLEADAIEEMQVGNRVRTALKAVGDRLRIDVDDADSVDDYLGKILAELDRINATEQERRKRQKAAVDRWKRQKTVFGRFAAKAALAAKKRGKR